MTDALKPCPFCGGDVDHNQWDESRDYYGCDKCDYWLNGPEKWNTRAADTRIAELEAENARLRVGYERYETARLMNVRMWSDAMSLNFSTGKQFDQIIDELKPFLRPAKESER